MWEYRYRNHAEPGSPMHQLKLSTLEYPTETKAMMKLQEMVLEINGAPSYKAQNVPTLGVVIDRFLKEERIEDILKQSRVRSPFLMVSPTVRQPGTPAISRITSSPRGTRCHLMPSSQWSFKTD